MEVHVMLFPFPAQGHLTSVLKLAELLSVAGFHVTFLNSDYNHHRLSRFSGAYARLSHRPGFRFKSIPDGLPDDGPRSASRFLELEEAIRTRCRSVFLDWLVGGDCEDGWPPVTCLIVDGLMTYAEHADLNEPILSVPGMEGLIRRRDLPSICRNVRNVEDTTLQFISTTTANTNRARALIFNTMELLEAPILSRIRTQCPITYSLGPLHSLLRTIACSPMSSISASLWQEDRSCIIWLNLQPDRSVIYISFGSFTLVSPEEMVEFWHGLVNSGWRFLWVVRPGSVEGSVIPAPPAELEAVMKERGCLVEWAPQEEVLAHRAVGCFLTHSGWNSTLESIMAGVPMICWPFIVDQLINSRYVEVVWKIGLDMKDKCERGVVERMVRAAMEGELAEELRQSVMEMAETGRRGVEEGGSSYSNFMSLVDHIKTLSSKGAR